MSSKPVVKKSVKQVAAVPVVVAPTPAPAPAEVKKTTKKVDVPSRSTSVQPPVPEPVVESEGVTTERSLQEELKSLQDQLTAIRDSATTAMATLKRVTKRAAQEVKDARKSKRKAPREEGGERKPSNFEIPVAISDELSKFFGGGKSALMSRAEVNKKMFAFAKDNFLSEGQTIHLVSTPALLEKGFKQTAANDLRRLLAIPEGEQLTIFNIQKYMGRHYVKATA